MLKQCDFKVEHFWHISTVKASSITSHKGLSHLHYKAFFYKLGSTPLCFWRILNLSTTFPKPSCGGFRPWFGIDCSLFYHLQVYFQAMLLLGEGRKSKKQLLARKIMKFLSWKVGHAMTNTSWTFSTSIETVPFPASLWRSRELYFVRVAPMVCPATSLPPRDS